MRVSSYNPQSRYRRRNSERMSAFLVVLITLGIAFGLGFWMGGQNAGRQERVLKTEVEDLLNQRETLQDEVTEARAQAQTAQKRYEQLQATYEETLPEGPLRDLLVLLRQQIKEGRSPERLEFLIRSARPPRNCTEPETKRFILSTPAYDGPESRVSLASGALTIKGSGQSAVNAKGLPEAWFDPSKTVKIQFLAKEGESRTKSGVLPVRHSMVLQGREYRITVAEGARSFAKVTFDSCDYP